jgi:hypothetical protein
MNITSAKYLSRDTYADDGTTVVSTANIAVTAEVDGEVLGIPIDPNNRHYAEILKQVADGDLTIAAAD